MQVPTLRPSWEEEVATQETSQLSCGVELSRGAKGQLHV